jgi:hypothetical protein
MLREAPLVFNSHLYDSWSNNLEGSTIVMKSINTNQEKAVKKGHLSMAQWQACNGVIECGRRHAIQLAAVLVH